MTKRILVDIPDIFIAELSPYTLLILDIVANFVTSGDLVLMSQIGVGLDIDSLSV